MLFAYSPFIVFMKNAIRYGLVNDGVLWRARGDMTERLNRISKEAEIVTNIGLLFGKQPDQRLFQRFHQALSRLRSAYAEIESEFVEALSERA
jgi:hypothetical protein